MLGPVAGSAWGRAQREETGLGVPRRARSTAARALGDRARPGARAKGRPGRPGGRASGRRDGVPGGPLAAEECERVVERPATRRGVQDFEVWTPPLVGIQLEETRHGEILRDTGALRQVAA